ncbi:MULTISPECIES: Na/Pi cotransporter family protein [unclassified Oceanispirochaeta]|uniref:Na/Pi cotransporter family protein n=1 Tax=unclassified Oceanispirochaeta TaxID=2635722 RepID=UPI000E09C00E|nr:MULTISPECIES: Na/Pi cotransporter family protein [unclassified Oceanispirochaeta]MBF9015732.1 Na/Pi cotransporter family protein [Oceanispirochaeta sp. M2]NPD72197.1 Na/Pi cotransporter family protein [Oceanispirochaeta sp. M1]RDG32296.1 Na/Pi cotransporter family protein [Oceanispirochaeta sp. M1]
MSIWNLFSLVGGLAIFLFGMMEMNKHLTSIAGGRMKSIMMTLTKGPARGYLTGLGITIINQSSSATTVLEAALVGAGLLTFQQSLAVTLGAELGSTFLPQLIAFPSITKFSTLIVFIGFIMLITARTKRKRHISLTVFTFGLLFLGMDMMSSSLKPLRTYEPFISLMKNIETPVLGMLLGLVFTMIIQSSGATTSITIAMALSGTISLEQAIPINLGAAVGTCITAVLGSMTLNWDAKRAAYIHIMFQLIGTLWVFILLSIPFHGERLYIWGIKWFTSNILGTESLARQIAMGFTFMPIINHIIVFPNLRFILRLFNKLFPERESPKPFGVKYIKTNLISNSIELSLLMTKKEIIRVSDLIQTMILEMKTAFRSKDSTIFERVSELDSKVDTLHKAIIPFLAELSQEELTEKESELCMNYMYIQNELESIGDVIDKNIMSLTAKKIEQNLIFSEEGFHELEHLLYRVNRNFGNLSNALKNDDMDQAKLVLDSHKKKEEEKYKKLHIERLYRGQSESIATSSVHLDLISYFAQINSHIAYIANRLKLIH